MLERLEALHVSSRLITSAPHSAINTPQTVQFGDQWTGTALQVNHPLTKAALMSLMATFPQTARVGELLDQCVRSTRMQPAERERTKQQILRTWSMNLLQLYATPPEVCARPGTRPEIVPLARYQAASGSRQVTNLRHEVVPIDSPFDIVVPLFDGQKSRDQIAQVFLTNDALGLTKKLAGQPVSGKNVALHSIETILERLVKESLVVR
jgi:methyltransferase-like protein